MQGAVRHFITPELDLLAKKLPKKTLAKVEKQINFLKINEKHPSLNFKKVGNYYSIRIDKNFRALAIKDNNKFAWFWVGKHSEYDKIIK